MRRFQLPGGTPPSAIGFTRGEKRRLFVLTLAAAVVAGALWVSLGRTTKLETAGQENRLPPDATEEITETVALPTIDREALEAGVADATREERVLLERPALDELGAVARRLTERHFELLEGPVLDAAVAAELVAHPEGRRGDAFLARGWVEDLRERRTPAGEPEWLGKLVLEDDTVAYFVAYEVPEGTSLDSFVRVDGLFLKVFSDESEEHPGTWIDGPLLVAPRVIRSYPAAGKVTDLDANVLAQVEDDVLVNADGSPGTWTGIPFDPLWHMMAYARDLPADAIDWDEEALELDADTLHEVTRNGAAFRGVPFRIPISRLQAVRVRRAGENPARIERYSLGWIGNVTWKNVIHFQTPLQLDDLSFRDYVTGRGFFLKNFAYASAQKGVHLAPVFVLTSLERFVPPDQPVFARIGYAVAITSAVIVLTITGLLIRDRRQARALQEDLVRRRRARRQRREPGGSMGTV